MPTSQFDPARISDPRFVSENRLPAHSDHRWFADRAEAARGESSFEQSLNGSWKFHYAKNLAATVPGFESPDFDHGTWDDIPVPAHIQLQGYDRPQYANSQYPWEGHEDIAPPQAPTWYNPVGSYVKRFTLEAPLAEGERLSVTFHGAESAIALWCNGTYIGYATDAFTPSEFDLTHALVEGENLLAAQVFKWTAMSWIEDQDFFRFSGLFRDVTLYRRPAVHLQDLRITTEVSQDLTTAVVRLESTLEGEGSVHAELVGVGALDDDGTLTVTDPHLWSSEDPHLYELHIEVRDASGVVVEFILQKVGIRRFGIEDGLLRINGERVVFHGVNRHEFGARGRV
ncbi:MAG: beta-galactosidase, partial [bacterium]|nr:beta-galactosidase [bacterium]